MVQPYLSAEEYALIDGTIPPEDAGRYLLAASRQIDSLTRNRITAAGFLALTPFQQEIIREVCAELADFAFENKDLLSSSFSAYSINGVSMQFGEGLNVTCSGGVVLRRSTYDLLLQTGLCYAGVGK